MMALNQKEAWQPLLFFCFLLTPLLLIRSTGPNSDFADLRDQFVREYPELGVPGFRIAYADNLNAIPTAEVIKRQRQFFDHYAHRLKTVDPKTLSEADRVDYRIMAYETQLADIRLDLEKEWVDKRPHNIPEGGLTTVPMGKDWYRYFLRRWIDLEVTPDDLYAFGMTEIRRVKTAMRDIERRVGLDSATFHRQLNEDHQFYYSAGEVQEACRAIHDRLQRTLPNFFPGVKNIPTLSIAAGTNRRLAQVPGYYNNQTFYYNFFDRPFEKRQIGWLYTHEGLPGHHYERNYTRQLEERSSVAQLFNYSAYVEGWGAYIEDIGGVYGAYPSLYDEYGKWEWDLIRSLRVPMDIGLNYYGWTDAEALSFWQRYSSGLDHIAQREIDRMRRWPAQVITYKYGATRFRKWQEIAAKGPAFDWVDFHQKVLARGPLPLSVLEELLE